MSVSSAGFKVYVIVTKAIFGTGDYRGHLFFTNTLFWFCLDCACIKQQVWFTGAIPPVSDRTVWYHVKKKGVQFWPKRKNTTHLLQTPPKKKRKEKKHDVFVKKKCLRSWPIPKMVKNTRTNILIPVERSFHKKLLCAIWKF